MKKQLNKIASIAFAAALAAGASSSAFAQGEGAAAGAATSTAQVATSGLQGFLANLGITSVPALGVVGTATVAIIGSAVVITQVVDDDGNVISDTDITVGTTTATSL